MAVVSLREVFPEPEWKDEGAAVQGSSAAYASRDMLVAVLVAADGKDLAERWPEVQQQIRELRSARYQRHDCYLLLGLPAVTEDSYSYLREALDDTLVCRKIAVPMEGDTLAEAIRHWFPLVAPVGLVQDRLGRDSGLTAVPSEDDLELLDRRSPEHIAEELLRRFGGKDGGGALK